MNESDPGTTATQPDQNLPPKSTSRDPNDSWWNFAAAVILSLTTLVTAWSGYEAARWSGENLKANRAATAAHIDSNRLANEASRQRTTDVMVFGWWFEAYFAGNTDFAAAIEERFSPEFVPAFEAWRDSTPTDQLTSGSPFDRPDYQLPDAIKADRLLGVAQVKANEADRANQNSDNFVLTTVLFASVLFLSGIATRLRNERGIRAAVIVSATLFIAATVAVVLLPINIGF